jgi:hypothetical protein
MNTKLNINSIVDGSITKAKLANDAKTVVQYIQANTPATNIGQIPFGMKVKIEGNGSAAAGLNALTILGFADDTTYNNSVSDEVLIEFDCDDDNFSLTVPESVGWANDTIPEFHQGWHYQISITRWFENNSTSVKYQAICVGFPCISL